MQPLPGLPTDWSKWRVFLFANRTQTFAPLPVKTHNGSVAVANPWAARMPGPQDGAAIWVVSYFLFAEGAAVKEAGSLLFYAPARQG